VKTLCTMIVWLAFKEKPYYQLQRLKQQQIRRFKLKSGIAIKVLLARQLEFYKLYCEFYAFVECNQHDRKRKCPSLTSIER
jgi:hypothetical protein